MQTNTYESFTVSTDVRGVTTVAIDVPNRPLNILNFEVMRELESIVRDLENDPHCRLVVFRSNKESGFLAGADVSAIANIETPAQATVLIDRGQQLFDRIDWLPMPTIAVIHGPCLGGGLEWSLACNYRIVRDNSSTKIGLPEIKLGVIPGWGGTQRLPKLVGLTNALSMILQGTHASARDAAKMGLVDRAIDPEHWDDEVDRFIMQVLAGEKVSQRSRRRPIMMRLLESNALGRSLILSQTEKKIRNKVEHYPALGAAVNAVRASYGLRPEGFMTERNEFVDLLATPTCRNLLQLFFAREKARNLRTWSEDKDSIHEAPIRKVGVIGAGAMGAGIGQLALTSGYDVVLKEVNEEAAKAGRERIASLVNKYAKYKRLPDHEQNELMDRVVVTTSDDALKTVDLVIEAVVERAEVKDAVFQSMDRLTPSHTILASNTSSLSVERMAKSTEREDKVAGLHFFNPVHKMELVEVVRAPHTSDATIARLIQFVRATGKTPIVTADAPGFLVNRVLFPYLGEAVLMVAEGHDVAMLDKQVKRFGMPMGPLELLDQVGIDVALHVARSLDEVLKDTEPVVDQLALMVDRGCLGKKSSKGFYLYKNDRRDGVVEIPHTMTGAPDAGMGRDHEFVSDGLTMVQRRLIYPMLAEAVRCKQEHIVDKAWAIDLAMVLGTGFAPHRGGPLHTIDSMGEQVVNANLRMLASIYGERFSSPELLSEMAEDRRMFFDEKRPEVFV